MTTDLSSLIERIEKSEGPDREIDAAIELVFTDDRGVRPLAFFKHEIAIGKRRTIPFTASIDAAMTLVPDGWYWTLGGNVHHGHWIASVNTLNSEGEPWCVGCSNACATPALALCAAALEARNPSHGN